jgi:ABC-type multidrug transport system ATPase subunit
MTVGIRTEGLRKVFTSPPPVAGGRGPGGSVARKAKSAYEVVALDGLTLEVRPGEIFGLLGPNGAGKSTTVGILTTRVKPTAGHAWIGPFNVWERRVDVKRLIGVVPQRPNLDFALTAREVLTFHGAYFGLAASERNTRADELLERFKLTDRANQLLFGFSGGMMQRLSIARAMMHDPSLLFLDDSQHGGSRRSLPPDRHRRPRQGDRGGFAAGAEAFDSRRVPGAVTLRRGARGAGLPVAEAARGDRGANES